MNFDFIAPWYRLIERAVFGKKLDYIRSSLLAEVIPHLPQASKALIIGDGDGRFLANLLKLRPDLHIDYVEMSQSMIEQAKQALPPMQQEQVNWIHANILDWQPQGYDLLTTHFVLDCFDEKELPSLILHLSKKVNPKGIWILSDFDPSVAWWARIWVKSMYLFFRMVSSLKECDLKRPDSHLKIHHFSPLSQAHLLRGFIYSSAWQKADE